MNRLLARRRKSLYVNLQFEEIYFIHLHQGLYVVTDLYPFHLQARKVF